MSLWQQLVPSPKRYFIFKLLSISFIVHGVLLCLLMLHTFNAPVSIILYAFSGTTVHYVPVVASDEHIAHMNARSLHTHTVQSFGEKNEKVPLPGSSKVPSLVVQEATINKAVKTATGIASGKIKKIKGNAKKNNNKKKPLLKKQNKVQEKKLKKDTIDALQKKQKKILKQPPGKKDILQQEKKDSIIGQEVSIAHSEVPVQVQNGASETHEMIAGDVVYVSYKDFDAAMMSAAFVASMKEKWVAPVGVSKECECEVVVSLDKNGKLEQVTIERSSNVLVYDMAVKEALAIMDFPCEVYGKVLHIVFKP